MNDMMIKNWLLIGKNHHEQCLALKCTWNICIYIIFEKLKSKLRVRKKEQNYLDGSGFSIVFLRAKHVGATALHMQH